MGVRLSGGGLAASVPRLTDKTYSDGTQEVSYGYDGQGVPYGVGHLTSISNQYATTSYTIFDALGRVSASTQTMLNADYTFAYSYNLADTLIAETYPSGRIVTHRLRWGEPARGHYRHAVQPADSVCNEYFLCAAGRAV